LTGKLAARFIRKRCGINFDTTDQGEVRDDLSKWFVLVSIAAGFFFGVIVGAVLAGSLEQNAFLIPAGITAIAGLSYSVYRALVLRRRVLGSREAGKAFANQEGMHASQNLILPPNVIEGPKLDSVKITDMDGAATGAEASARERLRLSLPKLAAPPGDVAALKAELRQTASPQKVGIQSRQFRITPSSHSREEPIDNRENACHDAEDDALRLEDVA
jgi:hypothetical protein